jgi:carboxymethylenebutenolidase
MPSPVHAASPEDLTVDAAEGNVTLSRYAAAGEGKRPAALLLHGSRGIELKPRAYERHALALAAAGIDAYLVRYFTAADWAALDRKANTPEGRSGNPNGRPRGRKKVLSWQNSQSFLYLFG